MIEPPVRTIRFYGAGKPGASDNRKLYVPDE